MITEGEAAIVLEMTLHAFRNQEKTKQRSTIDCQNLMTFMGTYSIFYIFQGIPIFVLQPIYLLCCLLPNIPKNY